MIERRLGQWQPAYNSVTGGRLPYKGSAPMGSELMGGHATSPATAISRAILVSSPSNRALHGHDNQEATIMTISMYAASVPVFKRNLAALATILGKAHAHCASANHTESAYLQARLFPDMFALAKQVQVAADFAKSGAARLAGVEPERFEDTEQSFAELKARVEKTIAYIETFTSVQIDGSEARAVKYMMGKFPIDMKGQDYLLGFILPNFFFHYTTAYNLLRHNGLAIGKGDFMGLA